MKTLLIAILFIAFESMAVEQKTVRVNLLNREIQSEPVEPFEGKLSIIIDNQSFSSVRFSLKKNDQVVQTVHVKSNFPKTLYLDVTPKDVVFLYPDSPPSEARRLIE